MTVTWATTDQVIEFLGADTVEVDDPWLVQATAAANQWCFDQRVAAGYSDGESVAPHAGCVSAVVEYAAMEFRRRGAIDGFAGDADLGGFTPSQGLTVSAVKRLLGVPKPMAVA